MINQSQLTPQIQVDGVNPIPNATVDNPTGDRVAYINDYEVSAVKTYSSSKITALISGLEGFSIKVVAELPASGDTKALYLTPSSNTAVTNVYDEYATSTLCNHLWGVFYLLFTVNATLCVVNAIQWKIKRLK